MRRTEQVVWDSRGEEKKGHGCPRIRRGILGRQRHRYRARLHSTRAHATSPALLPHTTASRYPYFLLAFPPPLQYRDSRLLQLSHPQSPRTGPRRCPSCSLTKTPPPLLPWPLRPWEDPRSICKPQVASGSVEPSPPVASGRQYPHALPWAAVALAVRFGLPSARPPRSCRPHPPSAQVPIYRPNVRSSAVPFFFL